MRFAVVFYLTLAACAARGQSSNTLVFDRLHSGDGLSHNSVYAIHQNRDGFMWFGTLDGLNRYDGYEFVVCRHIPADSTSISSNVVRAIHEDTDGTLWLGTQSGLCHRNYGEESFTCYDSPANPETRDESVLATERDSTGTLWIASAGGLLLFDDPRNRIEMTHEMEGSFVADISIKPDGLWVLANSLGRQGISYTSALYGKAAGVSSLPAFIV